jgi:xanthine dehydrogenase iron-sulfur cluster and FAD-binding subunit A
MAITDIHSIQQAFLDHSAFQCSYCTPGFILTTKALLDEYPSPKREKIRDYLVGNLCRCGSYYNIIEAVEDAAARMRVGKQSTSDQTFADLGPSYMFNSWLRGQGGGYGDVAGR